MIIRTGLRADEIRKIFHEVLEDFKDELVKELKESLFECPGKTQLDDSVVVTSDVCKRWGKSRTTLSQLIKRKKLVPVGR